MYTCGACHELTLPCLCSVAVSREEDLEVEKEGYAEGAVFLLSLEGVQDWTQVKQRKHLLSIHLSIYLYAQYTLKRGRACAV